MGLYAESHEDWELFSMSSFVCWPLPVVKDSVLKWNWRGDCLWREEEDGDSSVNVLS